MSARKPISSEAAHDLRQYARYLRTGQDELASEIEMRWGLYGYPPELLAALETMCYGLEWNIENNPTAMNECDAEALAEGRAAIAAATGAVGSGP